MDFVRATIKEKLKKLPQSPGVYLMKNHDGEIIYVGKSKSLKNRVSQYFIHSAKHSPKTIALVSNIVDFDYIITDNEVEALILECNLIKEYHPKYNILLKDDKQYPYIKISIQEEYPKITMTRKVLKDGARYFGPYMSAYAVKETIDTMRKIFKTRSCNKKIPSNSKKERPCLYYHIGQCSAPCCGLVSKEEYRSVFHQISSVLEGKSEDIISVLTDEMYQASQKLEFERAKRLRDKINSLKIFNEKQKMISTVDNNRDIIGYYQDNSECCIQIFFMRDGKISGSEYFVFHEDTSREEILSEFIKQYYENATVIPNEILLPFSIEDEEEIQLWLRIKCGHKIHVLTPQRGEKVKLVQTVSDNAKESLSKHRYAKERETLKQNEILAQLQKVLDLTTTPYHLECYDISNISGFQSIGACVVYKNAKESRKDYRRFRIKTVDGANDYESMREVIYRRFQRAYQEEDAIQRGEMTMEKAKFLPLPDIILLDGGKGHVSAVKTLMETLGETIPVFGLVKDEKHRTRGITDEKRDFHLNSDDMLFQFLTCVQDEVHRFAIAGFRKRHEDEGMHSVLEKIPGVGPQKRKLLLKKFIEIDKIKAASVEQLSYVVDSKTAQSIYQYFHERK